MQTKDFLFEMGTEELPARLVIPLATALAQNVEQGLAKATLGHGEMIFYATPRRLAVVVKALESQQADREMERKGPALQAAYDAHGQATPALLGFVRSCNTTIENLIKVETAQSTWLSYRYIEKGKGTVELLSEIINKAVMTLPLPKPMQWGLGEIEFIRPVHWLVMLYGKEVIPAKIFELTADRKTFGHRFHHPAAIELADAADYSEVLKQQGKVIVDFNERQKLISQQLEALTHNQLGKVIVNKKLLEEVTNLVEWPMALQVPFEEQFLTVPHEALIAAMEVHQKSFCLQNSQGDLLPSFITVSNIVSQDPQEVIKGNQRVMRARLSDAKFFYETDCQCKLSDRLDNLKHIIFQAKLGSLYDKSQRIAQLAATLVPEQQKTVTERAGQLCKADLVTNMVGEFPELQGIMGSYYAQNDGEDLQVATALREHYLPRFAGDSLPQSNVGQAIALADRVDTLVGIFGINQAPTGEKDPFALRRAALAVLRILIEGKLEHNLQELIVQAEQNYEGLLPNPAVVLQVHEFILDRFQAWYYDQNIPIDTLAAVLATQRNVPLDIDRRIHAVQAFRNLPEAQALAAANKRVSNLLKQASQLLQENCLPPVDTSLFNHEIEHELSQAILLKRQHLSKQQDYTTHLTDLASLQDPVDRFFETVLVMDDDEKLRNNRLALLASLRELFLAVADISLLQL